MTGHTREPEAWLYEHHEYPAELHFSRWDSAKGGTPDDFVGWAEKPLFAFPGIESPAAYKAAFEGMERALQIVNVAGDVRALSEEGKQMVIAALQSARAARGEV